MKFDSLTERTRYMRESYGEPKPYRLEPKEQHQ